MEDFRAPQLFNVEIGPEPDVTPHVPMPVGGPTLPVVVQEISADRDLYPARGPGVKPGIVR